MSSPAVIIQTPTDGNVTCIIQLVVVTGAGGGGATNLSYTAAPAQGTVTSDTGTDATLPLANGTNAGLMAPAQFTKLGHISVTQAVDLDAMETKLATIETNADVTDAANVAAAGAFMKSSDDTDDITEGVKKFVTQAQKDKIDNITITQAVDLDAIESRVNELDASVILKGTWDASAGTFPGAGAAQAGWSYIVSIGGTVDGVVFTANDRLIAITDNASTGTFAANWFKADYTDAVLSIDGSTGAVTIGAIIAAASSKATPVDADTLALSDSEAGNATKKLSWANIKATLLSYFNTIYAAIASPTFTGTVTTPAIIVSSETADTIAQIDSSKNIKSLPIATYPSLTELAYVKGVTSAIQTQLDSKQASGSYASSTFVDAISGFIETVADKTYKIVIKIPFACTINETVTMCASGTATATFKINTTALGGTANAVSNSEQTQAHASANSVAANDDIQITISSNAACLDMSFTIKITRTI